MRRLSLDFESGESRYRLEPSHGTTPEDVFERRWALTLLARALARIRSEWREAGKEEQFDALKGYLGGAGETPGYRELAERLGTSEGAVKVQVHRLRKRYRDVVRGEIAQTVAGTAEIDDEIRHLMAALAS